MDKEMTIIDKIAEDLVRRNLASHSVAHDVAQAAWDVVKAEMLGDEVWNAAHMAGALAWESRAYGRDNVFNITNAARNATIQKMEE